MRDGFTLPYTICFCRAGNHVLMLQRVKPPNAGKWNGPGGKIEPGETPAQAVRRELLEEAGLDLANAYESRFAGIVTWSGVEGSNNNKGMYAFVAEFPEDAMFKSRETREGLLSWYPLWDLLRHDNRAICENIPYFLPRMLTKVGPASYECVYEDGKLKEFAIKPLEGENIEF